MKTLQGESVSRMGGGEDLREEKARNLTADQLLGNKDSRV